MIIEKFSSKGQDAIERASRMAVKREHRYVTPWHLLAAILEQKPCQGGELLHQGGVDQKALTIKVDSQLMAQPKALAGEQQTPINRNLERAFVVADERAAAASDKYIGISHLLLALLDDAEVAAVITEVGGKKAPLENVLKQASKGGFKAGGSAAGEFEYLSKYTKDVTELAEKGELDPVIGREAEVKLTIEILSRRMKNNPIIIGEPGVGKTAIVEGLAQRIAKGQVPEDLKRLRVMSLDLGQIIAGTKFRGEFEERLNRLLEEVIEAGNVILFIDEIHMIIGAGGQEGSMDAANLLKPALARGKLRCIGATTLGEYKKRIERDAALMRRFQIVNVPEPTEEETVSMLRGTKEKYELHHGIRLLDEAISAAVKLSRRYLTDRFLPDKAFDLIDQTSASVRLALSSKPEPIAVLDQQIVKLEIESAALDKEPGAKAQERLKAARAELAKLKEESGKLTATWERERKAISDVQDAKKNLEEALKEKEQRVREEDFARVAELEYKVIPAAEKVLSQYADVDTSADKMLHEFIGQEQVAQTVSRITGIPAQRMVGSEKERLLQLEDHLRKRVVGQEEALVVVAKAVRRARAGVQNPRRPIASFLMLGPTGVGKTELAKALAEFLFDDERALVRFDMSEYMEKTSATLLTGAPPGYVGYEEGGVLTNKVRRRPYSVVLFDEVEKGHADVYNLFLQLFDDGRLTDSQGTTVDFANTIVIMTSNLGADHIRVCETVEEQQQMVQDVMGAVRAKFRPEFLNRLDDILMFNSLTAAVMRPIVDIQLKRLDKLLADKEIKIEVTDAAREQLAAEGYNPLFGARPLQRVIQTRLQDPIAQKILEGEVTEGATIMVDLVDEDLQIRTAGARAPTEGHSS